ncbi:HNH endonuclease signature motif containing protein [Nocardioides fonticola]|uniref:HNH endonuclease signature motif containing protein n=1 Tax=Nocardioides fonticola TaxID=450363 RepID=A0ABP7XBQ9_9ACTN
MASTTPHQEELDPRDPRSLLVLARDARVVAEDAERSVFIAAARWALAHPAADEWDSACVPGTEREVAIAGQGAPLVAEFCIDEFAAAIGLSTDAGHYYIGDALELAARLPRCWRRVEAGEVTVWRARKIAQATRLLSPEAVALVDQRLASFAHSIGGRGIEQTVKAAEAEADPEVLRARREAADDKRHVTIYSRHVDFHGRVDIEGALDLADALDLEDALAAIASQLKDLGCEESLDARRAMALGELARRETPLSFPADAASVAEPVRSKRTLQLYVHISHAPGQNPFGSVARVENTRTAIDLDTLRSWCTDPDTQLVVRPVLDLAEHRSSESYEIPTLLREQVILRDVTCVFPHCTRPARSADIDHIVPWDQGGSTSTDNLAALCRHHHRVKTHHGWTYTSTSGPPGTDGSSYLWTSPHGQHYLRTPTGTTTLSRPLTTTA